MYNQSNNALDIKTSGIKQLLDELLNINSQKTVIGITKKELKQFLRECNNRVVANSFDLQDGKMSHIKKVPSKSYFVIALFKKNEKIDVVHDVFSMITSNFEGQGTFTALIENNAQKNKVFVLYNK